MHVYIEDIGKHEGDEVTLKGWLHTRRSSGKIHFLIVRDGSGFIQAVMSKAAVGDEMFRTADHLSQETALTVTGTVRADKRAPSGYEIDVKSIAAVGASHDYPITPKEHGVDYLLDRRHLWIRSERQQSILRVRHEIINAVRDFFNQRGFILADTPIFTPAACEGTTTLFPAQYFDDTTAYLTQSGQLYNEANAMALGRVYCFGPTFRAEKSKTRRHLTEFWMVEPEMAYADLDDVMVLAEGLLVDIVGRVLDKRRHELKVLERDVTKLERVQSPFPRISYDEAVTILQEKGLPFEWGGDFGGPDETALSEHFDRPVMVHRYPAAIKAFYMKPDPDPAGAGAGGRRARAGGLRRDHRRRPAHRRSRPAVETDRRTPTAQGSLRLVYRSAPVRHGAAWRLRHGHRARRRVDLRPGTRARDHSVSADALSTVSVTTIADSPRLREFGHLTSNCAMAASGHRLAHFRPALSVYNRGHNQIPAKGGCMRRVVKQVILALTSVLAAAVLVAAGDPPPPWAYGFADVAPATPPAAARRRRAWPAAPVAVPGGQLLAGPRRLRPTPRLKQVPGSTASFTLAQIRDGFGPADWFPGRPSRRCPRSSRTESGRTSAPAASATTRTARGGPKTPASRDCRSAISSRR